MTINTKRIHDKVDVTDGTRILIVRNERIAHMIKCPFDESIKELAPSNDLYTKYNSNIRYHKWTDKEWRDYALRFREEMNSPESQNAITNLRERSRLGEHITLLYYCKNEQRCHRNIVKDLIESTN